MLHFIHEHVEHINQIIKKIVNELVLKGGARVGWLQSSYADLTITQDKIELNTLVSNLIFQPSDIISIEPYNSIVLFGQAVKINHRVDSYKKTVIFYTNSHNPVINQIEKIGFLNNKNISEPIVESTITDKQSKGGLPLKKGVGIGALVVWNLLFLTDFISFFYGKTDGFIIGNGVLTAIGLLFLIASLSLISADFRRLILNEGRVFNDIKKFAILIMVISGFMILYLGVILKLLN